jgi:hypothetical protein
MRTLICGFACALLCAFGARGQSTAMLDANGNFIGTITPSNVVSASTFTYSTPQLGFTNGANVGAPLAEATFITNTFGRKITATILGTNTAATALIGYYRFSSNGTLVGFKSSPFGSTATSNSMDIDLEPWGYFSVSNLQGTTGIKTNSLEIW